MTTRIDVVPASPGTGWVERRAKLFQSGEYPDKGISVSDEDLLALAEGFAVPVPVLIEHAESPLELGFLTAVRCEGQELHGTVSLSQEADALVRRSGARGLSLGLSPDLRSIREVSLVRNPRVAGAGFFSEGAVEFSGEIEEPHLTVGATTLPPMDNPPPTVPSSARTPVNEQPSSEISRLVREGRMVPSQVPIAEALLACDNVVEFSGDRKPLRELLIALLERQPPLALFGQTATAISGAGRSSTMAPEEANFYRRHFPGLPLETIEEAKRS